MTITRRLLAALLVAFAAACGGEDVAEPPASGTPAGKPVDAATAGAITGTIRFEGTVPEPALIRMTQDRNCVQAAGPSPQSDALLVSEGAVRNVFVHVKEGLDAGYAFPVPTTPVVLDQVGCVYTPRVLGIRVGQPLEVVNSDPTFHNVHALPMINREFNTAQPKQHDRFTTVFTAPEVMVRFKCDAHVWMAAWMGVMTHPYFAVSGADGRFEIPGLPPGTYTLEAWHERMGTRTATVAVTEGGQPATTDFTFARPSK